MLFARVTSQPCAVRCSDLILPLPVRDVRACSGLDSSRRLEAVADSYGSAGGQSTRRKIHPASKQSVEHARTNAQRHTPTRAHMHTRTQARTHAASPSTSAPRVQGARNQSNGCFFDEKGESVELRIEWHCGSNDCSHFDIPSPALEIVRLQGRIRVTYYPTSPSTPFRRASRRAQAHSTSGLEIAGAHFKSWRHMSCSAAGAQEQRTQDQ